MRNGWEEDSTVWNLSTYPASLLHFIMLHNSQYDDSQYEKELTCSNGVVLVKPRPVTRGPPTVGPMKFPRAKAATCHHDDNHDYGDQIYVVDDDDNNEDSDKDSNTITRSFGGFKIVSN